MTFEVVRVKKRFVDLTKAAPKPTPQVKPKPPEAKPKPEQHQPKRLPLTAAPDGPPIAADLPEKFRKVEEPVHKLLTDKQVEILEHIIQKAGDGHPKMLGLRLVLAASEDEIAAGWPIGLLSKALHLSGRRTEGNAVHAVATGCRVSRYEDMATTALALVNQKIEAAKANNARP
jgi:hypothetical protein